MYAYLETGRKKYICIVVVVVLIVVFAKLFVFDVINTCIVVQRRGWS